MSLHCFYMGMQALIQKILRQPTTTNTIDTYKILLRFFLCREKVQDSQVEDGWRSKQGTYTGVMMYVNDRFVDPEELEPLDDHCTRLVLNKPGGRIQLTRFLYKYRSQDPTTVRFETLVCFMIIGPRPRENMSGFPIKWTQTSLLIYAE